MKKEKKPLQVARETVRNLDSNTFLEVVIGNQEQVPLTSTVNKDPWGEPSVGCCGCA
jgi:hypothetical protein